MGQGCRALFAAADLFRDEGIHHLSSPLAPGSLFFVIQGILSAVTSPMTAIRMILTLYVFVLLYGYWFMLRAFNRPPETMLLAFPVVFNAPLCRGDLDLAMAIAIFPWSIWAFQRFVQKPERRNAIILAAMNLAAYYANLAVFSGVLAVQSVMFLQIKRDKRNGIWAMIAVISLLPLIGWVDGHIIAAWWTHLMHSPRKFLDMWYSMVSNCFQGYVDEWALILSGFALLIALAGRARDEAARTLDWPVMAIMMLVLLMPSSAYPHIRLSGMGAKLVVPMVLMLAAAVTAHGMKWDKVFRLLAIGSAVLAMVSATMGMTRWMHETIPYTLMEKHVHAGDRIQEKCRRKKSHAAIYPGWREWDLCIAATIKAISNNSSTYKTIGPVKTNPRATKTARTQNTITCGKHKTWIPTEQDGLVINTGGWLLYQERIVSSPEKNRGHTVSKNKETSPDYPSKLRTKDAKSGSDPKN